MNNGPVGLIVRGIIIGVMLVAWVAACGLGLSCGSPAATATPSAATPTPSAATPTPSAVVTPTPSATATPAPSAAEVVIEGYAYKPARLTVAVGTRVTWRNNDSVGHTATSRDNVFGSPLLSQGETYSYTFQQKGTFDYYCQPHPFMEGQVIVE